MKTAVSIPDDVFAQAERLAKRLKKSRSQLYSRALQEYVAKHGADSITEAIDAIVTAEPSPPDAFVSKAARRRLRSVDW